MLHPVGGVAIAYMTTVFVCTETDAVDATTLCSSTYHRYHTNTETSKMDRNRGTMRNTVGERERYKDTEMEIEEAQ